MTSRALVALLLVASAVLAAMLLLVRPTDAQAPAKRSVTIADRHLGEGWTEQTTSPEAGVSARAWSDLADGCHVVEFALNVPETAGLSPMRATLNAELAKVGLSLTESPDGPSQLNGPGITGLAELQLHTTPQRSAQLLACYWNEREPARCQAICKRTLTAQTKATP